MHVYLYKQPGLFRADRRLIVEFGGEVASNDGVQHGPEVGRALGAEAILKTRLRLRPSLAPSSQPLVACFRQVKFLGAAVGGGRFDFDQPVARAAARCD
jgi:hypothetical protein